MSVLNNNTPGLDSFSAAKYLFNGEEEGLPSKDTDRAATPDIKSYLRMTDPDDRFPTLSRRNDSGMVSGQIQQLIGNSQLSLAYTPAQLSANPDALDLANARTPGPDSVNTHSRHRFSHQSMPQGALNMFRLDQLPSSEKQPTSPHPSRHLARHSLGANSLLFDKDTKNEELPSVPPSRPVSMHSAYSASEIPTAGAREFNGIITSPKVNSDQQFQTNGAFGRIQPNGRQKKDSPERSEANPVSSQPQQLHIATAPIGTQSNSGNSNTSPVTPSLSGGLPNVQVPYYGYPLQSYVGNQAPVNGQSPQNYNLTSPYSGYGTYGNYRFPDSPRKATNSRRNGEGESPQMSRFSNFPLEHYQGELYGLCKDQHGCRYLQRKLEEQNPENVQIIFDETHRHVVELMTGWLNPPPYSTGLC